MDTLDYIDLWNSPAYVAGKDRLFELIDAYLNEPPTRILDIGCGYARVSQRFQEKYGTELYLLDGDVESTKHIERAAKYGSVDDFKFYVGVDNLKNYWDFQGMHYTFVDANNITIDPLIKFDLVTSWISCGFHYPYQTYHDLIVKHTDPTATVIMDFRRKSLSSQQHDFDIVGGYLRGDSLSKKQTLHIRPKR